GRRAEILDHHRVGPERNNSPPARGLLSSRGINGSRLQGGTTFRDETLMKRELPEEVADALGNILHHFWWKECTRLTVVSGGTDVAWEGEIKMLHYLAQVRAWFDRPEEGEDDE